eukprot:9431369-Pyramimonas_sp.AAC.1
MAQMPPMGHQMGFVGEQPPGMGAPMGGPMAGGMGMNMGGGAMPPPGMPPPGMGPVPAAGPPVGMPNSNVPSRHNPVAGLSMKTSISVPEH